MAIGYVGCPAMPVSWRGFEKAPNPMFMLPFWPKSKTLEATGRFWYAWLPWFPVEEEDVEEEDAEEDREVMDRWL